MIIIELTKAVESRFCVSNEDGLMIHDRIAAAIDRNEPVQVSFSGVQRLTTAFLNAAIGQLYDEYRKDIIDNLLKPVNYSNMHMEKWEKSVNNAQKFFENPEKYREISKETLNEE